MKLYKPLRIEHTGPYGLAESLDAMPDAGTGTQIGRYFVIGLKVCRILIN